MKNIFNRMFLRVQLCKTTIDIVRYFHRYQQKRNIILAFVFSLFINISCKKLVNIPPPIDTIVTEQVFSNDQNATAAVLGIYSKMLDRPYGYRSFCNGGITLAAAMSADEFDKFLPSDDDNGIYSNDIIPENGQINWLWQKAYQNIYNTNVCIENLSSNNLSEETKSKLLAEAKFLRAFVYFYLVNLFGDVPFITTSQWEKSSLQKRDNMTEIISKITMDLEDSKDNLALDFGRYNDERIRATKWAAVALLARINLYNKKWDQAEKYATELIDCPLFKLTDDPENVFLKNSIETILQLQLDGITFPYNATPEAMMLKPFYGTPNVILSKELISSFEQEDKRKNWIGTFTYSGSEYQYPNKYKISQENNSPNSTPSEYYTLLRLAEFFLIRAEAKVEMNKFDDALTDINEIRKRAGLEKTTANTKEEILSLIMQERRTELFSEWGHRWFDLKRTGLINSIMPTITSQKGGNWNITDQLYPIPFSELLVNPKLVQNPGYN